MRSRLDQTAIHAKLAELTGGQGALGPEIHLLPIARRLQCLVSRLSETGPLPGT
jgi:hypothetical protein